MKLSKHRAKQRAVKHIQEINKRIVRSQMQTHLDYNTMAPPKFGALSQMMRRSCRKNISSSEPKLAAENPIHMEGVGDVNVIPSPYPPSPTLAEDHIEKMQFDPPRTIVGPNQTHETNLIKTKVDKERIESDEPRAQPSIEHT
jgi:hypothetical protein